MRNFHSHVTGMKKQQRNWNWCYLARNPMTLFLHKHIYITVKELTSGKNRPHICAMLTHMLREYRSNRQPGTGAILTFPVLGILLYLLDNTPRDVPHHARVTTGILLVQLQVRLAIHQAP